MQFSNRKCFPVNILCSIKLYKLIIYILTNAIYSSTSPRILFQTNTHGTPAAIQYNDNHEDHFLLFSFVVLMQRMALLKYFKLKKSLLPDPEGPLCTHVSTSCIEGANKEVSLILNDDQSNKHSPYLKATPEQKAVIDT